MKTCKNIALIIGLLMAVIMIRAEVLSRYRFNKTYMQLWELADRSSTIPAKQKYVAEFVAALSAGNTNGDFAANDAVWLKTPANSFASNLEALKTLASRLDEIQKMSPTSFEYNTAIHQITQQEQGEAGAMLTVFRGCYVLAGYPVVWDWIGMLWFIITIVLLIFYVAATAVLWDE